MNDLNEQLTILSDEISALIRIIEGNAQVMQIAKRRIGQLESENRKLRDEIERRAGINLLQSGGQPTLESLDNGRECATGTFLRDAINMEKE